VREMVIIVTHVFMSEYKKKRVNYWQKYSEIISNASQNLIHLVAISSISITYTLL
jgi:hypothetical protein